VVNIKGASSPPPSFKTMDYVHAAIEKYSMASSVVEKRDIVRKTGCKGFSSLRVLPSHNRMYKVPIDPMHLIKNIVSHCIHLITGVERSVMKRSHDSVFVGLG
jgi:hypothetical protein